VKVVSVEFVTSAASVTGLPRDPLPQVALVGRSNVGKSSLINALAGRTVARTSAAPGKTRLINLYRVELDRFAPISRLYLVDLPGYGYARGGDKARAGFAALMREYFDLAGGGPDRRGPSGPVAAILIVDARHPGLPQDVAAWNWIQQLGLPGAIVASKVDKLPRGERAHALNQWNNSLKMPVQATSAVTGEGLEDLWTTIARLLPPRRTKNATLESPVKDETPAKDASLARAASPEKPARPEKGASPGKRARPGRGAKAGTRAATRRR
jgi:GTP-binding protein